jgi:E3 ubiquitin ligase SMURF1/2
MIGGLGKIDLEDWKKHTRLKHCTWDTNIVRWFWQAVDSFDDEMRARVLQFVTGSSRVPLQGFKALQGEGIVKLGLGLRVCSCWWKILEG